MTSSLAQTTVFKLMPRRGFIHVSDVPFSAPHGAAGIIERIKDAAHKNCYDFNEHRVVVIDEKGRVWMKDVALSREDEALFEGRYRRSTIALPGLNGEVLEKAHLEARRANPTVGIG